MIGGQYDDIRGADEDLARRHSLKTGRLFEAAVGCAIAVAEVPDPEQEPWRAFAADFGLLYQVVDDVLDGDGLAAELGREGATISPTRSRVARGPAWPRSKPTRPFWTSSFRA